jgi:hypothetical protein
MTDFLGFGQLTRPDIGLVADGVQNLAEIFKSDQDTALRNVRLNPEILDIIYGLSNTISKEDLRAVSGLSSLLLPTLHLEQSTFNSINNQLDDYINSRQTIGIEQSNPSLSGFHTKVDNVIIYNGSIQCEGVTYRTKVLGSGLYSGAENRNAAVSTSRASLFNSEQDDNGYFKTATYTGSIRVRRRSHVNRITLNPNTFVPRAPVTESPSHKINCYVDNGNTGQSRKLGLLTTKNSPLKIPCRLSSGTLRLGFQDSGKYFFGYQVQPLQSRVAGEIPGFLPLDPKAQIEASSSYTVTVDVTPTGYQNSYDLYLYFYLNPEKVTSIEFDGIGMTEFLDGKDIGLVGFNNLESLTLRGTSIKILPIWLKTLNTKLRKLDISGAGDVFYNSTLKYWDYRDTSATPSTSLPLFTMVSYLTIPKKGAMINEDGNDWSDASGDASFFAKYMKNLTRTPGTHFRRFTAMETISLGNRVYGKNPRFDDIMPGLESLSWDGSRYRAPISGTLPKINYNGKEISYSVSRSGASGSIENIGTSAVQIAGWDPVTDINNPTHISKYKIGSLAIQGEWYRHSGLSGDIGSAGDVANEGEWNTWFTNTKSIDLAYTNVRINLQPPTAWSNLQSVSLHHSYGTIFKADSRALNCPLVTSIDLYSTPTSGPMPTLGTAANTNRLSFFRLGPGNSISTIAENGFNYILPQGFATDRGGSNDHTLSDFRIQEYDISGRFRSKDFIYCYNLTQLYLRNAYSLHGKFPEFPTKRNPDTESKSINVYIQNANFYDLTNLNINEANRYVARDMNVLYTYSQNYAAGGCKLPDFTGLGGADATKIKVVVLQNSLRSTYPDNWVGNDRSTGQYIQDSDAITIVASLTPGRVTNGTAPNIDEIFYLNGSSDLRGKVLVNDSVRSSATGSELARVISVDDTRLYLDRDIPGSSAATFYFKRNTVDITNWFQTGFTDLNRFRAANCRLSGSINILAGFSKIADSSSEVALDLSNNFITGYTGGFDRIFSGTNRKITLYLSYNNFSYGVLRDMLDKLLDEEAKLTFTNVRIDLNNTKFDTSSRTYTSYTQEEIFPTSINAAAAQTISLTRTERVNTYNIVTNVAEDGTTSQVATQTGTKIITVKGKYISGITGVTDGYYRTKTNGRQQIVEDTLGAKFNSLRRWNINLGFTYQTPDTTPTVTSSVYSDPITEAASLANEGYTKVGSDIVPTEVVSLL